jgi:aminopeptidase
MDPRTEKLADVLVNYSTAVKPGEKVFIKGGIKTEPLILALYKKVLQAGGHPLVWVTLAGTDELRYRYASDEQLGTFPDPLKLVTETYDVMISLWGSENTKMLTGVDPEKIARVKTGEKDDFLKYAERAARGELRWVGAPFPTQADAQEADMGLLDYEDFVYSACLPDMEDPVGYWRNFFSWQQKIVDWFKGKGKVQVIAPGTNLQFSIQDRIFINCAGLENLPDGEIYTEPVKESLEGYVSFSFPTYYHDREVTSVRLWFEKGRVVKASADKGEHYLLHMLETDEGASYVGEFAIGTNPNITRITKNTLFDEKIGGAFHLALGASFPETGGFNESAIHWDMVSDLREGGEIWVDGELIHKDGAFTLDFSSQPL